MATFTFLSLSGDSEGMGAQGPNRETLSALRMDLSTPLMSPLRRALRLACTMDSYAASIDASFSGSDLYRSFLRSSAFLISSASAPSFTPSAL